MKIYRQRALCAFRSLIALGLYLAVAASALELPSVHAQSTALEEIVNLDRIGRTRQALDRLEVMIAGGESGVEAEFLRGVLLTKVGAIDDAIAIFEDITRRYPQLGEASNNLAALYVRQGNYERARQALLSAIANAPDFATARANLGDLYLKMAEEAYTESLVREPNNPEVEAKLEFLRQLFQGS